MKKSLKRFLASFLIALTVISVAPMGEIAKLNFDWLKNIDFSWLDFGVKSNALESSGNCGANVNYTFDSSTGTLTISGTGEMYDYVDSEDSPFYENLSIKEVIIESGVTCIGDYAFSGCNGLTSIIIPNSVISIGYEAFDGCTGLTNIIIPDSVTSIGSHAFYECTGLTSIIIPDSVTSIGSHAFYECTGLASITISDSVNSIENSAFENTGYYNNSSNWEDGVLYIGNHLIEAKESISGSYSIKSGTKTIASNAFYECTGLTSITIQNSVTSIGNLAFSGCTGLTSITIPDSVTSIDWRTFANCIRLKTVIIGNGVINIEASAFSGCTRLKSITIPNSVTNIGEDVFYGCTGLTSISVDSNNKVYDSRNNCNAIIKTETNTLIIGCKNTVIPSSIISIGSLAFESCGGLTSITIPNSVTSIGDYAFSGCTGLTNITIPNSVTNIGRDAFSGCTGLTSITIPNSVTIIRVYAFSGCTGLTDVTIGNSVTNIEESVFENCIGLTKITIPDSVTNIGGGAFDGCTGLTSVTIPNSVRSIDVRAFYGCTGLTSITIPNSVTSIGGGAFSRCTGLTNITIPNSVISIGGSAFYNTGYYNNSSNWEDGVLYIGNHLLKAEKSISGSYSIKSGTKTIAGSAFYECTGLISITIPNSVISIGDTAFELCRGLTSITIPNSVTSIGEYAFGWCTGLTSITIPDSVTRIGHWAFYDTGYYNNSSNWEDGVLYIGNQLIEAEESISGSYSIKSGTKTIADKAFSGCTGLTSITIPNSVTSIGDYAFSGCTELTNITIPNSVTSIGRYAFDYCTGLTSISVDSNNKVYDSRNNCNAIIETKTNTLIVGCKSTVIPNGVINIGDGAFWGCTGLTSITIPDSVTSIGEDAFYECTGLASITIPKSVRIINVSAFSYCSELKNVYYLGEKEDWNRIIIKYTGYYTDFGGKLGISFLPNATIHYSEIQSVITDKDTGISIECSDEFEAGTVIEVSEITDGKSVQIISEKFGETKSKIFDITPLKDGVKVQPDGKVTVKIPIPEGFNSEKLIVVYIDSVNGTTQNLPTKIVGKFIEFETDHFSHYAVVEVKGKVSSVQVSDVTVNKNKSTTINPNIKADTGVNYTVTYTSSNESVATVDNNGNVYGLKRGSATITCTVTDEYGNTVSDTCTVNVKYSFGQWLIVIFLFGWIWY